MLLKRRRRRPGEQLRQPGSITGKSPPRAVRRKARSRRRYPTDVEALGAAATLETRPGATSRRTDHKLEAPRAAGPRVSARRCSEIVVDVRPAVAHSAQKWSYSMAQVGPSLEGVVLLIGLPLGSTRLRQDQ